MKDKWIVSAFDFAEHATCEGAQKERDRLAAKFPKQTFRVYRIKNRVIPQGAFDDLLAACKCQHTAIDYLFALLIGMTGLHATKKRVEQFYPSKSGLPWAALVAGNAAIKRAEEL